MTETRQRGPFLTLMAVLYAVMAVDNATKALQNIADPTHLGIVVFGVRCETFASNLVFGPLLGLLLAVYAYGLWYLHRSVVAVSIFYAFYVPVNLVLFWYRQPTPDNPSLTFILTYLAIALGGSIGTALYLGYHRDKLA